MVGKKALPTLFGSDAERWEESTPLPYELRKK